MGDRCYVQVTISKKDYERLLNEKFGGDEDLLFNETYANEITESGDTVDFFAEEVNYAEWDALEDILKVNGIEYDKHNGAGCEYDACNTYVRFIDGAERVVEISDTDESLVLFLERTLKLPDNELRAAMENQLKAFYPFDFEAI